MTTNIVDKNGQVVELTAAQQEALAKYAEMGIKIGLATGSDFNEEEVKELINKHRVQVGMKPSEDFLIYDSPYAAIEEVDGLTLGSALYGQHDIDWLIYCQYYRVELQLKGMEPIAHLLELSKRIGWFWLGQKNTVITRRPDELHLLTKPTGDGGKIKVMHNYNDMAIKYRDGRGQFAFNGTAIPDQYSDMVYAKAEDIDVKRVMSIKNTEVRTEFLKKIGVERAFDKLDKKKLDEKEYNVGGKYELFSLQFGENTRIYLRGCCPSNNEYFFEAVPPTCTTVDAALNFRNGYSIELPYAPPPILT